MLPIDEHAKSGAEIYIRTKVIPDVLFKVRYLEPYNVFADMSTSFDADTVTHYLPASWVENAGAMRQELELAVDYGWHNEHAIETLAATEWPKGGE